MWRERKVGNSCRRLVPIVLSLVMLLILALPASVSAATGGQLFGLFSASGAWFTEEHAYVTTPDCSLCGSSGAWTATPTGVGNPFAVSALSESGALTNWFDNGRNHPYGTVCNDNGSCNQFVDTAMDLAVGGLYEYKTLLINGVYYPIFCSSAVCEIMQSVTTRNPGFPYAISGAESQYQGINYKWFLSEYNQFAVAGFGNTLYYWCYNGYFLSPGEPAAISGCQSASWTLNYLG